MSKNNPFVPFSKYILRNPLLPINFFYELTSLDDVDEEVLKKVFFKKEINESIFLASPELYDELAKWGQNKISDVVKQEKLKISLLKYIARMSSRCTPFGLFAGCSIGKFEFKTDISLNSSSNNLRHTRLDMNYLVALSQDLAKIDNIKSQLLFFPNTSVYRSGSQYRYIEYEYVNGKRFHHIVGVDYSKYLEKVLNNTGKGMLVNEIINLLIDDDNPEEVVQEFVYELIDNQLLISELEPSMSGPEFLEQITVVLGKIKGAEKQLKVLKSVKEKINAIDTNFINSPDAYSEISNELEELNTPFNRKFLFQTDLVINPVSNHLSHSVANSIRKGLALLNKISIHPKENMLTTFRDEYYDRFEDRKMQLSKVLDVEFGIGYRQNSTYDINPLIDDIVISQKENPIQEIKLSKFNKFFNEKLVEALSKNSYVLTLSDNDLKDFDENWDDLPDTISSLIEIVEIDGKEKLVISSAGGSSAANLLGRFCHGDKNIHKYVQEIVNIEERINKDKILAEIIHLPESRIGNIVMRPQLRSFEIPFLAKSLLDQEYQVNIEDLFISVKNNHISLFSEKHKKEVIPD